MAVPIDPYQKLRRRALAAALNEVGLPTAEATLATMASRGGGPPYQLYGRIPIYTWGPSLSWAEGRLSAPRSNTSEGDALKADLSRATPSKNEKRRSDAA
jgi:hypothetical protein